MKMRVIAKYSKDGDFRTPEEKIVHDDNELYEFKERCNAIADFMQYEVEYVYKIVH